MTKNWETRDTQIPPSLYLLHQPHELVEGDAAIVVLVNHADQLLQLALQRRPPERPHDLAQLHRGDGAAPISLQLHMIRLSTSYLLCFVDIYS